MNINDITRQMKFNLKNINLSYMIIVGLVVLIFLQRSCGGPNVPGESPIVVTKIDTVWKTIDKIVTVKTVVKEIIYRDSPIIPSNDIDTCKKQVIDLSRDYFALKIYSDTLQVDSYGTVVVLDTITENSIFSRMYIMDLKIPEVTKKETITNPPVKNRQLYVGGNLYGQKDNLDFISPGILYKDKKDRIFMLNVGMTFDGYIMYGVGTYWKINLNKKQNGNK